MAKAVKAVSASERTMTDPPASQCNPGGQSYRPLYRAHRRCAAARSRTIDLYQAVFGSFRVA